MPFFSMNVRRQVSIRSFVFEIKLSVVFQILVSLDSYLNVVNTEKREY